MTYDLFLALRTLMLITGKMAAQMNTHRQLSKSLKQASIHNVLFAIFNYVICYPSQCATR